MDATSTSSISGISATNAVTKYDDTLIPLANARIDFKKSIVKYYSLIKEAELNKLKKMTFKEIDPSFCDTGGITFQSQPNQITKQFLNAAKVQDDKILQSKNLNQEATCLREVVQKLQEEKKLVPKI